MSKRPLSKQKKLRPSIQYLRTLMSTMLMLPSLKEMFFSDSKEKKTTLSQEKAEVEEGEEVQEVAEEHQLVDSRRDREEVQLTSKTPRKRSPHYERYKFKSTFEKEYERLK